MSTPVGPYSPWRRAGDWVVISGQIAIDPAAPAAGLVGESAPEQLTQALTNARAVLADAGCTFDDVVKATLFLVDMGDFAACNEIWVSQFTPPRPTRSAIAVAALPLGARCEVELWAYKPATA